MDSTPLIQIYDNLKKYGDKLTVPFGSPDISLTRDRSPGAIISH